MTNQAFLSEKQSELVSRLLAKKGIRPTQGASIKARSAERARLSFPQQQLWILDRLNPGLAAYNIPISVKLEGALDYGALQRSFDAVLARHRILSVYFDQDPRGEPFQTVREKGSEEIRLVDLASLDDAERDRSVESAARELASAPFDLARDRLIRVQLFKLSQTCHILVVVMHHIVSDAWSLGVFVRELARLYEADVSGFEVELPTLSIQFTDFAEWQRDRFEGTTAEEHLQYWRNQLSGELPQLELPTDRERGIRQTFEGATVPVTFDAATTAALRSLARKQGATTFMVLLAAFKVLLHKYTGQQDVIVGTPVAGRNSPQVEPLVGLFANTLALRSRISAQEGFDTFVQRVKGVALDAFAHQEAPFDLIVQRLEHLQRTSRSPVFQALFSLQNANEGRIELRDLILTPLSIHNGTSKHELTLTMMEDEDSITGSFEYNSALFERASMTQLSRHFGSLISSIVRRPQTPIAHLSLLDEKDLRNIKAWQGERLPLPQHPVHEIFRDRAMATPDAIALHCAGASITFDQLRRRVDALASRLREAGVGPESRVGLFVERSIDMVVAVWATLQTGGAYVPLDPRAPSRRTLFVIEDAGIETIVVQRSGRHLLPELPTHTAVLELDSQSDAPITSVAGVPSPTCDMDNLAYVLYTSGSTGQPKGVQISHGGLANYLLNWCIPAYGVADGQGAPLHTSLGFDLSVTSLLAPLLAGRAVWLLSMDSELDALSAELSEQRDFSLVKLTPAHLDILNHQLEDASGNGLTRALVVGGEALSSRSVRSWLERHPSTRILNEYGPTETVVGCSVYEANAAESADFVPIGRPIPNAQMYVVDAHGELAPVGVTGEIWIGGAGVARGYVGRPALTAERFVPDPYADTPGQRVYRSGDLGKQRPDGTLIYIGRIDSQVKLRGHRIELGEVEAALRGHPSVCDAAVLLARDANGSARLVAHVATRERQPTIRELQEFLGEWLPEYMVPRAFSFVEALPLTSNGKVDRQALSAVSAVETRASDSYAPPTTITQELIASIWEDVLGIDRVGVESNFFELGGHSLLALQVAARIRQALQTDVPLHVIFEAPTIAQLARRIQAGAAGASVPLFKAPANGPFPLSFAQQRLWFLYRLAPDAPTYNIFYALKLRGEFDLDVFEQALTTLIARHEVLRTSYPSIAGEPRQNVHEKVETPLRVEDVLDLPDPEQAALASLREETRRPFDLENDRSPLRVVVFRVKKDEYIASLVIHHIASDARSTEILVQELMSLYGQLAQGQTPQTNALDFQYKDFAVWQRRILTLEKTAQLIEYWHGVLGEKPPALQLPTDKPRRPRAANAGRLYTHSLSSSTHASLQRAARKHGVTPFIASLAAFQVLLGRYSGQRTFFVGAPMTERATPELDRVIGLFLNVLPLRAELEGNPTLAELLARVSQTTFDALAHQQLPFEQLVDSFKLERDRIQTPLFQVAFTYQHVAGTSFGLPGVEVSAVDLESDTTRFEMTLLMIDTGDTLQARVEYDADLFEEPTVARMMRHLELILAACDLEPECRIDDVELLSAAEREQVVYGWNQTQTELPTNLCLHRLFERRVSLHPEAIAAEFSTGSLTYGQLDRRANQLARALRERGVDCESVAAVCLDRSPEMLIGLLAILKAGAAYVPLDPSYPSERLAYMVEDSAARVVLTQRHLVARLPARDMDVLCLDDLPETFTEFEDTPLQDTLNGENLAYIIYTSGSTGKPKGVMVNHSAVVNHCLSMADLYGLDERSGFSQFFSLSFDGSVEDIFPPLLTGGRLLCHPNPMQHTLRDVLEFYGQKNITVLHLPTALWHSFATQLHEGKITLPASVCITSAGGEALTTAKLQEYFAATNGQVPFLNVYGPTEATVTASTLKVQPGEEQAHLTRHLPIGRPLPNVTLYVLDRKLQPTPIGVAGELFIGGAGVARGYLNRPALTAEKFVPDPFGSAGSRLYKTGDLCRFLADGNLEYLGRSDHQVKIRSFRIELAEIEAIIAQHPSVREVLVEAREVGPSDRRIVAYCIPASSSFDPAELRQHIGRNLPAFMIPSAIVELERMPLTPNGKVDRARLPAPDYRAQASTAFVAPRTAEERRVAAIWKDVLGHEEIGSEDNFFELGGHSLLAVRVHERLQQEFAREIPLIRLFEHPTLAALARFLVDAPETHVQSTERTSEDWARNRREALRRQHRRRKAGQTSGVVTQSNDQESME